jgi:hypothetical protein
MCCRLLGPPDASTLLLTSIIHCMSLQGAYFGYEVEYIGNLVESFVLV